MYVYVKVTMKRIGREGRGGVRGICRVRVESFAISLSEEGYSAEDNTRDRARDGGGDSVKK